MNCATLIGTVILTKRILPLVRSSAVPGKEMKSPAAAGGGWRGDQGLMSTMSGHPQWIQAAGTT